MSLFNAEEYWKDKKSKKWVCTMNNNHVKYVMARTKEKAKQTAVANSFHKKPHCHNCRLATPQDLGIFN